MKDQTIGAVNHFSTEIRRGAQRHLEKRFDVLKQRFDVHRRYGSESLSCIFHFALTTGLIKVPRNVVWFTGF